MLSRAEVGQALGLVLKGEWVVHNTESRLLVNAETNEHSASWQVSFDEIAGSIQGVNPNNSIFGVE